MKLKLILLSSLIAFPIFSFEINTHQAITRCALADDCQKRGAENLNYFAYTMLLSNKDYAGKMFEGYGATYFDHAVEGDGLAGKAIGFKPGHTYLKGINEKDGQIDFTKTSYISLIEAGSILEDAMFHNVTPLYGLEAADGRFNNYFYWAQNSHPVGKPYPPLGYRPVFWLTDEVLYTNSFRLSDTASLATNPWDAWPSNRMDAMSWALDKDVDLGGV